MGAQEHTMMGLSGISDLMLTCLGNASRNKAVGVAFGKGQKIQDILNTRTRTLEGVAEGVATAPAAERLAKKHRVSAPMIATCAACLCGELDAESALWRCMELPIKPDKPILEHKFAFNTLTRVITSHLVVAFGAALLYHTSRKHSNSGSVSSEEHIF